MAVTVLTNCYIALNSVDLSDHARSVELTFEISEEDATAFGNSGYSQPMPGLKSGSLNIEFNQDYASGKVDKTLWTLVVAGTVIPFEIRPDAGAVSATNPKWTGNAYCFGYSPISGSVGGVNTTTIPFKTSGAITRAEA